MSSRFDPRLIPVAILLVVLPILASVYITDRLLNDDGSGPSATSSTTPTPRPIEATGTIGYITPDGNFALMDPNGGNQRLLTQDGNAKSVTWSPDGSVAAIEISAGPAAKVRGVTPDGSVSFEIIGASLPLWSPQGDKLAVAQEDAVSVFDAAGALLLTFEGATLPTWAPDGSALAFLKVGRDGNAIPVIGDLETGGETPLAADIPPAPPEFPIAWHPAGAVVAYRDKLYEPATGNTTSLPGTAVFWSPNGRTLLVAGEYSAADRGTPGMILDASQDFKQIIGLLIRQSAQDIPPQLFIQKWTDWTPDGRYLFYLDPEMGREFIRVYDTEVIGQDIHRNIAGERPDISPDGKFAAFMYQDKVWVFPLDASTLVAVADGSYPAWQPQP